MWIWLEAHCGLFACIHRQCIVAAGSISQSVTTHCMRQIHLGHFVPSLRVAIDLSFLADTLWPAGWSLVPLSVVMNCQMKHWRKWKREPQPHRANVTTGRFHETYFKQICLLCIHVFLCSSEDEFVSVQCSLMTPDEWKKPPLVINYKIKHIDLWSVSMDDYLMLHSL